MDGFGGTFKFNLPGHKSETALNTSSGAILTIFMWTLMILYGAVQLHSLYQFTGTNISTSFIEFFYTQDNRFPQEIENLEFPGFQIAFAIAAFDDDPDPIDDDKYGRVVGRIDRWGYEGQRNRELRVHRCTDEELGLTENKENAIFYPLQESMEVRIHWYARKLFCIDEDEEFHINGDFYSDRR